MINMNAIARLINSTRVIDMDAFEKLVKNTYNLSLEAFPFCSIVDSVHRILGHVSNKMRRMGNTGLGQISEQMLESMHKKTRINLKYFSRPFLKEALRDTFIHLWYQSSYLLNSFSGKVNKQKKIARKTADDLFVASFYVE